jgi:outer membrane protein TolC
MKNILIATFFLPAAVMAQNNAISLEQAVETGLANNLNIKMAQRDVEAAEWKVKEYKSVGLPQVNGKIDFQNFLDIPTTLIPAQAFNPAAPADEFTPVQFGTNFNINANITLSQLLFDGSYITGLKAAKMYPVLSQQQLEMAKRDLKYNIRSAYYNAVVAEAGIGILTEIRDTTALLLQKTGLLIEAGLTDSTSYDQLSLTLVQLENSINSARRNYALALQLLRFQMGIELTADVAPNIRLTELLQALPPAEFGENFNPTTLLEHQLMETQITLLELNTKVNANKKLPSVGAFFTHQQQAMKNDLNLFEKNTWFPATIWGLNVAIPIWSSGQLKSVVSQNQIDVVKTQEQLALIDRNMMLRVAQARTTYASALEQMVAERKNIVLAQRILQRNMIRYAEGMLSSLELTQAQTQYLNAQSSYIAAAMQLLSARVELDKSLNL